MEKVSKAQIKLIRSLQQKKFRDEQGLFVAEGDKCVEELRKGFELVYLIVEEGLPVDGEKGRALSATRTEIEQMSGLRAPQGVIGVFKKPAPMTIPLPKDNLVLALDGIQDPGNLGTIIRTCDWFGVRDIFCSLDTADCFNPKVVQATMGSLARVRIHYVDLLSLLDANAKEGALSPNEARIPVYGTLLDGKNMYREGAISDRRRGVIIMGNEGNGIRAEVRRYVTHPLYIPAFGEEAPESLNVAISTAVVLAEFRRG